jgi:16S rRNA (guanine(966)-N(2))-methyltransferase RsmD
VLDRPGLRPTPNRLRETLFNWLGQDLTGWRCLDAFAGSGALGFEAASRGAAEVVLLERDARLVRELQAARDRLGAGALRIEAADAIAWMKRCEAGRFDLVFVDPPFDSALFGEALSASARLLAAQGFVYLESPHPWADASLRGLGLAVHRHARAGQVHAHLLRPTAPGAGKDLAG